MDFLDYMKRRLQSMHRLEFRNIVKIFEVLKRVNP